MAVRHRAVIPTGSLKGGYETNCYGNIPKLKIEQRVDEAGQGLILLAKDNRSNASSVVMHAVCITYQTTTPFVPKPPTD
jgi:hypothetical protein